MPTTATKPGAARRLAKEAKMLGVRGYASMSGPELKAAVEAARNGNGSAPAKKKTESKPATATKPAVRRPATKKVAKKPARPAAAAKKAPPKKAKAPAAKKTVVKKGSPAAPKAARATGDNPFREGSNSFLMAAELLKGGNRGEMVKRLKKAMKIHPWSKPKEEDPDFAIRKRMLLVAAALEKDYGYTIVREGRGEAGTIQALPPGKKAKSGTKKK